MPDRGDCKCARNWSFLQWKIPAGHPVFRSFGHRKTHISKLGRSKKKQLADMRPHATSDCMCMFGVPVFLKRHSCVSAMTTRCSPIKISEAILSQARAGVRVCASSYEDRSFRDVGS